MKPYLKYLGPGLSYGIGLLGVIAYIAVMATGVSNEDISMAALNAGSSASDAVGRFNGAVDFLMTLTIVSVVLAGALILIFLVKRVSVVKIFITKICFDENLAKNFHL